MPSDPFALRNDIHEWKETALRGRKLPMYEMAFRGFEQDSLAKCQGDDVHAMGFRRDWNEDPTTGSHS